MNRRDVVLSLGAAGLGAAAGGWNLWWHPAQVGKAAKAGPMPSVPPDPGYAHGPVKAVRFPVHNLHDLTPAAPPNAVALTIDDGPHPVWTPKLLDLLAEFEVPATFHLIGQQVTELPAIVQRIAMAGHQLADHTVTHPLTPPLTKLPSKKIEEEILGGHDRIAQATGISPKFFRSPGGWWNQQVFDVATAHGMTCLDWQVDPRDWSRPGIGHITGSLLAAKASDILLCHDGGGDRSQTIAALRTVIPALKQRGLTFVAL
jgi:peptidoglycan/xylan/chitin deacetylase (PgdA/CDA1 family)